MNGAVTCEVSDCGSPKGLVGVEGEGYRIEFRNLKVKELRETLLKLLGGAATAPPVRVPGELIVRESTAPPRKGK